VLLPLLILTVGVNAAQAATPVEQLDIGFDLEAATLKGEAALTLPAGLAVTLFLGDLQVQSLTVDGAAVTPQVEEQSVQFDAVEKDRQVHISYTKQFPADSSNGDGGTISSRGIALFGLWHPTLSVDCRYSLTAVIPASFAAVSEAEDITETPLDGNKKVSFSFDHPLGGINFVAGPYVVSEVAFGDNQKLYAYFFAEDKELAPQYLEKALGYLNRYAKLIGPYPYKRFSIVENRLPTGYAMPTFTLLGQSVVRLPFIVDTSLGHEILHAWFGNCVRVARDSGNWSEGLVTYLADQSFAAEKGEGIDYRKNQLTRYESYVNAANAKSVAEFFGADFGGTPSNRAMRAIGYDKASMIFHMLRKQLGDAAFYDGLRAFFKRMQYKRAAWEDLQVAFEETSNSSLDYFFDQWVRRSDEPVLGVKNISVDYEEGIPRLCFVLFQTNEVPYRLVVRLRLFIGDEQVDKIVQIDAREKKVDIPLGKVPSIMSIDPDYDLMRRLDANELAPVWSRFEGAARKLVVIDETEGGEGFWQPLLERLQQIGCTVKKAADTTDDDVAGSAVLFLGVDSPLVRSLFAKVEHPSDGLTVDVRANPIDFGQVAVLVSAADPEEVQKAAYKIEHYGKYSYLHFIGGRIEEKSTDETMQGMRYLVDSPPPGIAVDQTGRFNGIIDELMKNRVVYVGETHTSYEDHLLQFRIIRALYERDGNLAIGMEMFSRQAQAALDAYIAGKKDEKQFLKDSDYFEQWGFDYRYYRDILRYAQRHRIPVVGLNIDKKVVSKVFEKGGPYKLDQEQRSSLPEDRDLDMPGYEERIYRFFLLHGRRGEFKDFFQSQALWDETMAQTAARYLQDNADTRMVILAGHGHIVKDNAIPPRLYRRLQVPQAVVSDNFPEDIDRELVDYIFFAPPQQLPPAPIMGVRLEQKGGTVKIIGVEENSPAAKAGIRPDDVLLSINGAPVGDIADIKIAMLDLRKGDKLVARVRRAGFLSEKEIDLTVDL